MSVIQTNSTGVLVIAHGSRDIEWVQRIEEAVKAAGLEIPVEMGYLELVEGVSIADGVRRLEARGVDTILAVPLFVASASTHLEEIQYALGILPYSRVETELELIHPHAKVVWCDAMDDHPYVIEMVSDMARQISQNPRKESLLLVGHGSDEPEFHEGWEAHLTEMGSILKRRFHFTEVRHATLYPDTLREQALQASADLELIVLPLFLSQGYLTRKSIPERLKGIEYRYAEEAYLPHPLVSRWLEETVKSHLLAPAIAEIFSSR
jgi:sirohydrochlorin cobaltochelatase